MTSFSFFRQGEDYLVKNFSATSGGKFSESTKNQIFGAYMYKTLIQELLTLFPPENMCKFGFIAQKVRGGKIFFGGK